MTTVTQSTTTMTQAKQDIAFTLSDPTINTLFEMTRELSDLAAAASLQGWDQQTQMAMGSNKVRAPQMTTLRAVIHERQTAPALGQAIAAAERTLAATPERFTVADHALARESRRAFDHAVRIPVSFVREFADATSAAWEAWMQAKAAKDFSQFESPLAHIVDLCRQRAALLDPQAEPYAVLFDLFEPGLSLDECRAALEKTRAATVALLAQVRAAAPIDDAPLHGDFTDEAELRLSRLMLEAIGYRFDLGRLDLSAHPFTQSLGSPYDVRVTTRLDRHNMVRALLPAMHEGGHALYELGIDPALCRSALGHGTSLGIHESQSRFWENVVGRAAPFWQAHYHVVQEVLPQPFAKLPVNEFVRALNRVKPDNIRVEADELTYNLHIIIRFELEQQLISGKLAVKDLPTAWNQKYHDYLGVDPENDAVGVMQDIHWSHGSFGYFSTYSLGNLFAAQFAATMRQAFPDMDARLAKGETAFLREWQRDNIHRWGRIWRSNELSQRITGEPLNPDHFIRYVTAKFTELYSLK
jgi:carboxypeptidase Taq